MSISFPSTTLFHHVAVSYSVYLSSLMLYHPFLSVLALPFYLNAIVTSNQQQESVDDDMPPKVKCLIADVFRRSSNLRKFVDYKKASAKQRTEKEKPPHNKRSSQRPEGFENRMIFTRWYHDRNLCFQRFLFAKAKAGL